MGWLSANPQTAPKDYKDKNTTTSSNKGHTPRLFSLCRWFIYFKARAGSRTQIFQAPFWLSTQNITPVSTARRAKVSSEAGFGSIYPQSTPSSFALSHPSLEAGRRNWSKGSFSCLSLRFCNSIPKLDSLWNIQNVQNKNLRQFRSQ